MTNLNLILQTNNIETKTKKSVDDFCSMRHAWLFFFAMAHLGVVDEEELDVVCSERETVLNRRLHHWEREVIQLQLRNENLKAVSREERLHIPGFDKVVCSSFCSHLLDLLIVKEITAVRNRFNVLKRRPDFDEMILPARKVARSGAEREQAVCFSLCLFDLWRG